MSCGDRKNSPKKGLKFGHSGVVFYYLPIEIIIKYSEIYSAKLYNHALGLKLKYSVLSDFGTFVPKSIRTILNVTVYARNADPH